MGLSGPVARPSGAQGSGVAFTGALRGGYAIGDLGFEPFAEFGGNFSGPKALWLNAGARWMFSPFLKRDTDGLKRGAPFFIGPEISGGMFVRLGATKDPNAMMTIPKGTTYSSSAVVRGELGLALDVAYALSRSFQLEAELGNLRWIPSGDGSILLLGATLAGSLRF